MNAKNLLLPVTTLGFAAVLLLPSQEAAAFSKIGGSLGVGQRDVRTFNNFADVGTNDNNRMFPDFPGFLGAEQAIWKGSAEWNSAPRGGDPTQGQVGDGGSNFDITWQGNATGIGNTNNNIVSAISSCGGGTIAFTELPISDGWRIRFCDNLAFSDGPANIGGFFFDLQGVQTHEYGHALGLGHTNVFGATMFPSGSSGSVSERSIHPDDIAGLQCIYGVLSGAKPVISNVTVDTVGNTVTITGTGFDTTATNDVWFTNRNASSTSSDPRVRVLGVAATGGGTSITVSIPANAGAGEILVKNDGGMATDLSNSFATALGEPIFGLATFRNGSGSNPTCFMTSDLPQLGLGWDSSIDASGHPGGAGFSGFLLHAGASSGIFIAAGELLVDVGSTQFAVVAGSSSGATDNYSIAVPGDLFLYQRNATAQGFTFSVGTGLRLCNAFDLVLGGRP